MAGGVNIKMGVSGVAQFKQSISQARQNMKTLDAQLKLTEKQYKATGDAETYMQQKTEQLKAKLEEQKAIAANAEKALADMSERGVDKSSKAFQDMIRTLANVKGDMIDTEQQLQGISESSEQAGDGVSEMNSQLANVGQGISWQNVTSGIESLTGKLERAGKAAFTMGQRLIQATLGKGAWADQLAADAQTMGLTTDQLQRMQKTAQLIDTSVEAIVSSQKKLKKGLGSNDAGVMGGLLELLGEGYDPRGKDWETVFWDAGEALMKFSNETEKEVYAQKLFGRSWNELIPLFEAGRKEYEKTNASWNTLSDDQMKQLTDMDDQYQKLNIEWEDFKTQLLTTFSPALTTAMEKITGVVSELNEYLQTPEGKAMLEQMSSTITTLIDDLLNINPEDVVNGLKTVIDGITDAFKWIQEHHGEVVTALEVIVAGWAALKLTGGILDVLKIINAVKGIGITSSAAASAGATAGTSWAGAFASAAMKAAPFLAFLYTLLNPSGTSDELGNNTLLDKEGNLTEEAKAYGYTKDENGDLVPKLWTEADDAAAEPSKATTIDLGRPGKLLNASADWQYGDDLTAEEAMALVTATDKMSKAAEDLTGGSENTRQSNSEMTEAAKGIKGMPKETAEAIRQSLNGAYVRIDGERLTAYVGEFMAQWVAGQGGN
ncbi:MAG: hypothetical protein IKE81_09260 [Clostridia bacterium]|nr:hypothetical protein [Clostridia bacterium]